MKTLTENPQQNLCYNDHLSLIETFSYKLKEMGLILNYYTHSNQGLSYDNENKIIEIKMFYIDHNQIDHMMYNIKFMEKTNG